MKPWTDANLHLMKACVSCRNSADCQIAIKVKNENIQLVSNLSFSFESSVIYIFFSFQVKRIQRNLIIMSWNRHCQFISESLSRTVMPACLKNWSSHCLNTSQQNGVHTIFILLNVAQLRRYGYSLAVRCPLYKRMQQELIQRHVCIYMPMPSCICDRFVIDVTDYKPAVIIIIGYIENESRISGPSADSTARQNI